MRTTLRLATALGLLVAGYVFGSMNLLTPRFVEAQDDAASGPTPETQDKIKLAMDALQDAQDSLVAEQFYNPAIDGLNAFAITVGGVDAMADLESGQGVDPETFVALYAGKAGEMVKDDIARDGEGRLTYKGKIVRMYSISRLKKLYAGRDALQNAGN